MNAKDQTYEIEDCSAVEYYYLTILKVTCSVCQSKMKVLLE